jgi:hypothetical protein
MSNQNKDSKKYKTYNEMNAINGMLRELKVFNPAFYHDILREIQMAADEIPLFNYVLQGNVNASIYFSRVPNENIRLWFKHFGFVFNRENKTWDIGLKELMEKEDTLKFIMFLAEILINFQCKKCNTFFQQADKNDEIIAKITGINEKSPLRNLMRTKDIDEIKDYFTVKQKYLECPNDKCNGGLIIQDFSKLPIFEIEILNEKRIEIEEKESKKTEKDPNLCFICQIDKKISEKAYKNKNGIVRIGLCFKCMSEGKIPQFD